MPYRRGRVLQRVHLPQRLSILLEGESLLNDATGLVLFRFALAAAVTGTFSTMDALGTFLLLALGGAVVGAAIAALWIFVVKRLHDEYLVVASSVLLCWAAYIPAEMLHVSGVIATVVAGLVCGWYQHVVFSAAIRLRGTSFWTVMVFLLEASVFMLIGSSLRDVIARAGGIAPVLDHMAVASAVDTARADTRALRVDLLLRRPDSTAPAFRLAAFRDHGLARLDGVELGWHARRGDAGCGADRACHTLPERDFLLVAAFAVILVTVLVQGTTLGLVIRWLRPPEVGAQVAPLGMSQAEAAMAQAQVKVVEARAYAPDGTLVHPQLLDRYRRRATISEDYAGNEEQYQPRLQAHFDLVLEAVAAARAELLRLHRAGRSMTMCCMSWSATWIWKSWARSPPRRLDSLIARLVRGKAGRALLLLCCWSRSACNGLPSPARCNRSRACGRRSPQCTNPALL